VDTISQKLFFFSSQILHPHTRTFNLLRVSSSWFHLLFLSFVVVLPKTEEREKTTKKKMMMTTMIEVAHREHILFSKKERKKTFNFMSIFLYTESVGV